MFAEILEARPTKKPQAPTAAVPAAALAAVSQRLWIDQGQRQDLQTKSDSCDVQISKNSAIPAMSA